MGGIAFKVVWNRVMILEHLERETFVINLVLTAIVNSAKRLLYKLATILEKYMH